MKFTSVIKMRIGNPYILVSKERATKLKVGWKKPMPVLVQINGEPKTPWKINMMPVGNGNFYLYLHGDVRKASGTGVGDLVKLMLRLMKCIRTGRSMRCHGGLNLH